MPHFPRAAEWRSAGQWFDFRGHRIFVAVQGEGPPVLLLHGFPTASYDFCRIAPLLSDSHRLIMPDFLGFGFSDKPRNHPYSLFEQAEMIQALAAHFGVERAFLLTHDMGNSVTLELMRRGSPVLEKVVMLNGSVLLDYYRPLMTQKLLLHPLIGPLMTRLRLIRRPVFARQFARLFAHLPPDDQWQDEVDQFWALINANDGAGIYHLLIRYLNERLIHQHDWLDALQAHAAPLTVIWGLRDPVSVPRIAEEGILIRRKDAIYLPLNEVGHYPQWEQPDLVAQAARRTFEGGLVS